MLNPNPKGKTILVVEDNKIVRQEVVKVFSEAGFTVFQAENGEKALEACKTEIAIDLVLLDIVLPLMTGLQCYDEIKRINPLITIILTSFAAPPESFRSRNPDFLFIEKSQDLSTLPQQIMDVLNQPS